MPAVSNRRKPDREIKRERMTLAGADRAAFLDALMNPPEPSAKLIAALRRHRDLTVAAH